MNMLNQSHSPYARKVLEMTHESTSPDMMRIGLSIMFLTFGCSSPASDATCLPDCEGTRSYDAISYDLRARFDWDQNQLIASEEIALEVAEAAPVVEFDAAVAIDRVHAGDRELPFSVDADDDTVTIDLSQLAGPQYAFTVDYTAAPIGALIASRSRDDDPVTSRVVFTDSEPEAGVAWLVAKQDPDDRALFSAEFTVDPDEDVIAPGTRVTDRQEANGRVVGYSFDRPIPTYIMAFAAGQLEHTDRATDGVPLALWYRRGLVVDAEENLDVMEFLMAAFERLLGPYPFDSYAVALLPFDSGMENATVTFNDETSGQGNIDFFLHAHELAHSWFGDWMTVRTFDDLWVKEGMATLLEEEADRARADLELRGRLFAAFFDFEPEDAVVDPALAPEDKFTSGPYERAATLITQIRATVGEDAFWRAAREMLSAHALDSIDGETFVRSFPLNQASADQIIASLQRRELPRMTVTTTPAAGATEVTFQLDDPAGQMIVPLDLTAIDRAGDATTEMLSPGGSVALTIPAGGYLAGDEADLRPEWETYFELGDDYEDLVVPLLLPARRASAAVVEAFTSRSASVQEVAMSWRAPPVAPADFAEFYAALDSVWAQNDAVIAACELVEDNDAWIAALAPMIAEPAATELDTDFGVCPVEIAVDLLEPELARALDAPTPASLARAEYLISFDYGPSDSLDLIGAIATGAPTLYLRELALERLVEQTDPDSDFSTISAEERPRWQQFFEARLLSTMSDDRFEVVWEALLYLDDLAALPIVGSLLGSRSPELQVETICDAFGLAGSSGDDWAAFQEAAMPWDMLAPEAAAALADPSTCDRRRLVAARGGRRDHLTARCRRPRASVLHPRRSQRAPGHHRPF